MSTAQIQKDRIYELVIGNQSSGEGFIVRDLQITFDVRKSASAKDSPDRCRIKVYNLSENSLKKLESEYLATTLSCGYKQIGLKRLYAGEVTYFHTRKEDTDRVTEIQIGSSYVDLNDTDLSEVVPAGSSIEEVIERIRKSMADVAKGVYTGDNIKKQAIYGYPLSGTAREMLDEIAETYEIEYRIDNRVLYVNDIKGNVGLIETVPVLSTRTGLIQMPYYTSGERRRKKKDTAKKQGLEFTCLLNPDIKPGSLVTFDEEETGLKGQFKIDSIEARGDYRGQDWYTKGYCSIT